VLLTRLNRAWHKKQVFKKIDQAYLEKDYLKAAKLCDEQIATHKVHEIDLLRMKATLMFKSGEPEKAREAYERVLKEREYQWARTGLAKIRMANGEYEQARQIFQTVIAENRYYMDAYDQLAAAHTAMGQPEEACTILERASKLSPNSVGRQRALGQVSLKLGNMGMAEKAFRKCIAIGEYSVNKTPEAYFGLARVCGLKNDTKEALQLLLTAQREFSTDQIQLRAKITEGMVYHESGDYRRARKAGEELDEMLNTYVERPDTPTCMDMSTLLFAVGMKETPVELLCYVIKNNHDNTVLLDDVQKIFDKARMSDEGFALIKASKKEASDMMNQGVLLWKTGKLPEAVEWMREARTALPNNMRILFNSAQILISHIEKHGFDEVLSREATDVLLHVDKVQPGQQRFAQLMEQLAALAPSVAQVQAGQDKAA